MRVLVRALLASIAVAASGATAPQTSGAYRGFNVILISLGNVGARHMSLYGYARKTTPGLAAWSKDALVFETAFSPASWTLPVGVSLFTSLYPYGHGVWSRNRRDALSPDVPTLPALLRDAGYRTAAFTGGLDYDPAYNYLAGFESTQANEPFTGFSTTLSQASRWLERGLTQRERKPFFLFVHGYDAHCPFAAGKPYAGAFSDPSLTTPGVDFSRCMRGWEDGSSLQAHYARICSGQEGTRRCLDTSSTTVHLSVHDVDYMVARYDETVLQEDRLIADFLASLGSETLKTTIVAVVADHGEMFARHGRLGRAGARRGTHYDDVLRIPLIVRLPGAPGRRVPGLVETTDVMPTLLELLGLPAPPGAQGKSLGPLIAAGTPVHDTVYSGMGYTLEPSEDTSLPKSISITETARDSRWKVIRETRNSVEESPGEDASRVELYDVSADPDERYDLAKSSPAVVASMLARLSAWAQSSHRAARPAASTHGVPKELLEKAKERGYWP